MGFLTPKYPTGAEPAAKAAKPSRRQRQASEDAAEIRFCEASTAHQKAIATHGRDSLQASRTRQAMNDANRGM